MSQQRYKQLDEDNYMYWRNFCIANGELRSCKRGDRFLGIHEETDYLGFVISGALKLVVYDEDNNGHIIGLYIANDFISDYPFVTICDLPKFEIIAEEDCSVFCVPISTAFSVSKDIVPKLFSLSRLIFQRFVTSSINHYTKSPEQRYLDLVENEPLLLKQFSLRDIASYLNVTRTHLSRIRNNVYKQ